MLLIDFLFALFSIIFAILFALNISPFLLLILFLCLLLNNHRQHLGNRQLVRTRLIFLQMSALLLSLRNKSSDNFFIFDVIIYNFSTLVLLRRKNASEILNYSNTPAGGFINLLVSSLYRKNGSADRGNLIQCNI